MVVNNLRLLSFMAKSKQGYRPEQSAFLTLHMKHKPPVQSDMVPRPSFFVLYDVSPGE